MNNEKHECMVPNKSKIGIWGDAVGICYENENNELWVGNEEYATQVNFCPICGYKAIVQIEK